LGEKLQAQIQITKKKKKPADKKWCQGVCDKNLKKKRATCLCSRKLSCDCQVIFRPPPLQKKKKKKHDFVCTTTTTRSCYTGGYEEACVAF
jgi:hypothetical protein